MNNINAMSRSEYLYYCLLFTPTALIWFYITLFRNLPGMTYFESVIIILMMIVTSAFICLFAVNRRKRTILTLAATIVVPLGIYTVLTYKKAVFESWISIVLAIAVVLEVIYTVFLLTRKIKNRKGKVEVIKQRFCCWWVVSQAIAAITLLVVMVTIIVWTVTGCNIIYPSVTASVNNQLASQTIIDNIDTVLLLKENEWVKQTTQKKLDILQTITNAEAYYLGLPNELNVAACNLDSDTLGNHDDNTHTIFIDITHLEKSSAHDVLDTCCHEVYHSYQHRLVDAYNNADKNLKGLRIYSSAAQYKQEFDNYIKGENDFHSYYNQYCESDARDYAKNTVTYYYDRIMKYLNETPND